MHTGENFVDIDLLDRHEALYFALESLFKHFSFPVKSTLFYPAAFIPTHT